MHELEEKIAAWRAAMHAAMPGRADAVNELEAHLRDHLESLARRGVMPAEAWAASLRQLGEGHGIAREFNRVRPRWLRYSWPVSAVLVLLALLGIALLMLVAHNLQRGTITPLLATHVIAITGGYLTVLATGLIGVTALVWAWRSSGSESQRREAREIVFRLGVASLVLETIGILLGMVWAAGNRGRAWSWSPVEVGAASVWFSTLMIVLAQTRRALGDPARCVIAILGAVVVAVGWFGHDAVTAGVPISWLCLAFVLGQAGIALLRTRATDVEAG